MINQMYGMILLNDITSVEVGLLDLSIPTHDAIGPSFLDTPWKCWMGRDLPLQK